MTMHAFSLFLFLYTYIVYIFNLTWIIFKFNFVPKSQNIKNTKVFVPPDSDLKGFEIFACMHSYLALNFGYLSSESTSLNIPQTSHINMSSFAIIYH